VLSAVFGRPPTGGLGVCPPWIKENYCIWSPQHSRTIKFLMFFCFLPFNGVYVYFLLDPYITIHIGTLLLNSMDIWNLSSAFWLCSGPSCTWYYKQELAVNPWTHAWTLEFKVILLYKKARECCIQIKLKQYSR
jgi:hypothetical protein